MAAGPGIDVSGWLEAGLSGTPSLSQVGALALLGLLLIGLLAARLLTAAKEQPKNLVDPP